MNVSLGAVPTVLLIGSGQPAPELSCSRKYISISPREKHPWSAQYDDFTFYYFIQNLVGQ